MRASACLVITSIQGAGNRVLRQYAQQCRERGLHFIVAGDCKTPENFNLEGCEYLGIKEQQELPFRLAKLLPHNNYAKKNLAYLQAIRQGHSVIIETDDDNIAREEFWQPKHIEVRGALAGNGSWVNIYSYFSETFIWPRGFSLPNLKDPLPALNATAASFYSPVQQALVDDNPDVDAIYRLCHELPFRFRNGLPVILDKGTVCPFNSQNTTWFSPVFLLMYLPSYCSFRMCDIWRSFIAQRILWTNGWHLSFLPGNAYQERNEHDLIKDFGEEVNGYLNNHTIVKALRALELKEGPQHIADNLRACYRQMIAGGYIDELEMPLLEAWIDDLQKLY